MTRDFEAVGNVPVIDMPNTDNKYNSHQYWFNPEQSVFCLLNEKNVKKGDEVNVNYSQDTKNPWIMFAQYAFALGKNIHKKGAPKCKGLGPDSELHQCQNPVACNISSFAKRYCSDEFVRLQEEIETMKSLKEASE